MRKPPLDGELVEVPEAQDSELGQHDSILPLPHAFSFDRRGFFKVLGGGLLVCIAARHASSQESGAGVHRDHELPKTLDSWLHIGENGEVTAFTGKVEVGQNARTSLAQQVAEELRVPLTSVRLIMGDTELTPYDMGTFGSRTTPTMAPQPAKPKVAAKPGPQKSYALLSDVQIAGIKERLRLSSAQCRSRAPHPL